MKMKKLLKTFVLQHDQSDCGVACLKSILKYYDNHDVSLDQLRTLSGTTQEGTTLLGLYKAANIIGLQPDGLKARALDDLKELKNSPAILHVVLNNLVNNYIVFYGEDNGEYVIGDPISGVRKISSKELDIIWQSRMLLKVVPNGGFTKSNIRRNEKRKWLTSLIKDDLPILFTSIFVGILVTVLGISTAIFSQKLIDSILPNRDLTKLVLGILLLCILLSARAGLNYVRGLLMLSQAKTLNSRVNFKFYFDLLRLPKSFFDSKKTGELIARMNDTRRIQSSVSILAGSAVIDVLLVLTSIIFCFSYSWMIGLITVGCLPIYIYLTHAFSYSVTSSQKAVMSSYAATETNYIDSIHGISTIKVLNKEAFFDKINQFVFDNFQNKVFSLGIVNIRFGFFSEVLGNFIIVLVFAACSWAVLESALTAGEFVALISIVSNFIPAILRLVISNISVQEARVAFDRMYEFTSLQSEVKDESDKVISFEKLVVKNMEFGFPGRSKVLNEVYFEVKKGEIIVLTGESGSGKSTLLQILQRFYKIENGDILLNDVTWDRISMQAWRKLIGIVPQEIKLFGGTLAYNICLSDSKEDHEKVTQLANELGLNSYFSQFPQGYNTLLGESGVSISGGQRQLVAIARALFHQPQLLLLDEATSAMDSDSEQFVLDMLKKVRNEAGIIIITHRMKATEIADRIYELKNGKLVAKY